jgi:hypothetical protein
MITIDLKQYGKSLNCTSGTAERSEAVKLCSNVTTPKIAIFREILRVKRKVFE